MILPLSYVILWALYCTMFYGLYFAIQFIVTDRANIIFGIGMGLVVGQILLSFIQDNKGLKDEYLWFFMR